MQITFRQLRLFQALAETGSVTAAARVMHVSQPTASMQLRDVSNAVGLPLYEVVSRRVRLTDVGHDLARTARCIANEWDSFEQKIDQFKGRKRGKLRVSVVSTAKYFVPRLLGSFCAIYPEIEIALEVLNRDGVLHRLRENMDDLCIMSMPPSDIALIDQVFMPNPLVVIAKHGHPLSRQQPIALEDLRSERFILRELGSGTRMTIDAFFKRQGFKPQLRLELGSNEAIKEAVAGGLGISVISLHALPANAADQTVTILDVNGFPVHSNWHLVYQAGRQLSPIAQAFHDHLFAESKTWPDKAREE